METEKRARLTPAGHLIVLLAKLDIISPDKYSIFGPVSKEFAHGIVIQEMPNGKYMLLRWIGDSDEIGE